MLRLATAKANSQSFPITIFDHWHPVLRSRDLGSRPIPVRLAGRELVLFRTNGSAPAALEDSCPHRRMRLSCGSVCEGRLRCPYHGWSFDAHGAGESPATPKLYAAAESYDVCEAYDLLWVRARGSKQPLPELNFDGAYFAALVEHRVNAPLEVVLDNFTEIEHTATVHGIIGYPLERLHEVTVRFEADDNTVRAFNVGPSKPLPFLLRALLGVQTDSLFHSEWTTHFSPVWSATTHYWSSPRTGREARIGWTLIHFFTPLDPDVTQIWTFSYIKSRYWAPSGGVPLFRWLMKHKLIAEINEDKHILENLSVRDGDLLGMKLSRFDRTLGLNRERLARVYRGE